MEQITKHNLKEWNAFLENLTIEEAIAQVVENTIGKKVFSTSFGIEDQLVAHFIAPFYKEVTTFTLDTGRQFNETYEVFQKTQTKYKQLNIITYFPLESDIQNYVSTNGVNGFYDSVEKRKECCFIRKVKPLQSAIANAQLWITGVRAAQSTNRNSMEFLEFDEANQIIKFNPLLHFTLQEVEAQISLYKIPISALYAKGYVSIGCAPCTKAIAPGEDFRAGRWWWEQGKKECGLHAKPLNIKDN